MIPGGARAIMNSRQEPPDSLDYFPTPPWAGRALVEHVLRPEGLWDIPLDVPVPKGSRVVDRATRAPMIWEPACGEGHLAAGLGDYAPVICSDVHDYGPHTFAGAHASLFDFLNGDARALLNGGGVDGIVTNPPYGKRPGDGAARVTQFSGRALALCEAGLARWCAMFVRLGALTTVERYELLFRDRPPTVVAFFVERVAVVKGRYDPDASTATDACWLVWARDGGRWAAPRPPVWIPPCKAALYRDSDAQVGAGFAGAGPRQGAML